MPLSDIHYVKGSLERATEFLIMDIKHKMDTATLSSISAPIDLLDTPEMTNASFMSALKVYFHLYWTASILSV